MQKKLLLHICCGVCACHAIKLLESERYSVTGFFYNPNIHPYKEYLRRKKETEKIAKLYNIKIIEGNYELNRWKDSCDQFRQEKEGGKRCNLCFKLRLEKTYQLTQENNFDYFTSTLTISPHKNSQKIFQIGENIGGNQFLNIDFKKKDGFKKTIEQAKKLNLYRQNYCGCIYSLRDRKKKIEGRS
ncbi:MAG: epoxyqueuosine reductase QueH [Candidatus Omnitrophica bacterium]|nr:epoxyqueuosine reductase QueH [Candidatus Omnitrophota bacterium]MCF7893855.1 epoxyqueuosine reductase QueH [Candidatus Omnitrophota bacterium]